MGVEVERDEKLAGIVPVRDVNHSNHEKGDEAHQQQKGKKKELRRPTGVCPRPRQVAREGEGSETILLFRLRSDAKRRPSGGFRRL